MSRELVSGNTAVVRRAPPLDGLRATAEGGYRTPLVGGGCGASRFGCGHRLALSEEGIDNGEVLINYLSVLHVFRVQDGTTVLHVCVDKHTLSGHGTHPGLGA